MKKLMSLLLVLSLLCLTAGALAEKVYITEVGVSINIPESYVDVLTDDEWNNDIIAHYSSDNIDVRFDLWYPVGWTLDECMDFVQTDLETVHNNKYLWGTGRTGQNGAVGLAYCTEDHGDGLRTFYQLLYIKNSYELSIRFFFYDRTASQTIDCATALDAHASAIFSSILDSLEVDP